MSDYLIQEETLTNIANAIREKTGNTDAILVSNFANEISNYTPIIVGTEKIEDGSASNYVNNTLYIVYKEV